MTIDKDMLAIASEIYEDGYAEGYRAGSDGDSVKLSSFAYAQAEERGFVDGYMSARSHALPIIALLLIVIVAMTYFCVWPHLFRHSVILPLTIR